MTIKEAVKILRMNEQEKWRSGISAEDEGKAVKMAIEALQREQKALQLRSVVRNIDGWEDFIGKISNCVKPSEIYGLSPTIDKEGEWNDDDKCTRCGKYCLCDGWGNEFHSTYCPSCGARMKEGGEKCD